MLVKQRAAFVGEAMIELTPLHGVADAARLRPAGDALNTAVYFRRAASGDCEARFVTALGDDPFSDRIADFARDEALEPAGVRRVDGGACGLYAVSTTAEGERSFSYWRSASAARSLFSDARDFTALEDCDVVLVTGVTLAIMRPEARQALLDWITAARGRGVRLAFDSNYRPKLWESRDAARDWTERFWRVCDIAFPSVDDEMVLFGDRDTQAILARFRGYGVGSGALKAGGEGSWLMGASPALIPVAAVEKVVDTTAAGDSFNGGFLAALMQGAAPEDSAHAAHALAREVIQHPGAITPRVAV